jgi:Protein of unknown function (DUF4236)
VAWRFQRRKQLLPGVRANIGKRGLSSLSFGRSGARLSVGQSGTQGTITALGTGLSYIFRRGRRR